MYTVNTLARKAFGSMELLGTPKFVPGSNGIHEGRIDFKYALTGVDSIGLLREVIDGFARIKNRRLVVIKQSGTLHLLIDLSQFSISKSPDADEMTELRVPVRTYLRQVANDIQMAVDKAITQNNSVPKIVTSKPRSRNEKPIYVNSLNRVKSRRR